MVKSYFNLDLTIYKQTIMRPPERINKFFLPEVIEKISKRWQVNLIDFIEGKEDEIKVYWEMHPDQRFGQMLINLNILSDSLDAPVSLWHDEDINILMSIDVYLGDIITWKSYYDKDSNLLDYPIIRYIKDLDTDHILAIMSFKNGRALQNDVIRYCLSQELKLRRDGQQTKKLLQEKI